MIAFVGICCSVVGTVLGAMKATGREHLTVPLLMMIESTVQSLSTKLTKTCIAVSVCVQSRRAEQVVGESPTMEQTDLQLSSSSGTVAADSHAKGKAD